MLREQQEKLEREIADVQDQNSKLQIQVNKSSVQAVDEAYRKQKEAEKAMESLANEELAFDMMKQNTESQIEEKERELSQKYKAVQQQIKKEQEESINLVKNFASATAVDYTAVKTYKENEDDEVKESVNEFADNVIDSIYERMGLLDDMEDEISNYTESMTLNSNNTLLKELDNLLS